MRERPILFSGPMVRAILDGHKTQTRRVVRDQPPRHVTHAKVLGAGLEAAACYPNMSATKYYDWHAPLPYQRGDRLWVRETWLCSAADHPRTPNGRKPQEGDRIQYAANPGDAWQWRNGECVWRPSIHMPRWAARLVLDVKNVRIDRLQAISANDAWAEGIPHSPDVDPAHEFRDLWDSLNAKRGHGWNANPWVWVYDFTIAEATSAT